MEVVEKPKKKRARARQPKITEKLPPIDKEKAAATADAATQVSVPPMPVPMISPMYMWQPPVMAYPYGIPYGYPWHVNNTKIDNQTSAAGTANGINDMNWYYTTLESLSQPKENL